ESRACQPRYSSALRVPTSAAIRAACEATIEGLSSDRLRWYGGGDMGRAPRRHELISGCGRVSPRLLTREGTVCEWTDEGSSALAAAAPGIALYPSCQMLWLATRPGRHLAFPRLGAYSCTTRNL